MSATTTTPKRCDRLIPSASLRVTPEHTKRVKRLTGLIERALRDAVRLPRGTPRIMTEAIRYCVLSSGKRFRPLLCLGACQAVGGRVRQALPVVCSIELMHAYSLVHDDLPAMDNADERRGRPSCHRKFGEATAILVGDALLTRAFEVLGSNHVPNVLAILRLLGAAGGTAGLIGGQTLDLAQNVVPLTVRYLEGIARRKTAVLITASVVAGGLAGRASAQARQSLRQYGERVGLAFQLIDDLHDGDGLVRAMSHEAVRGRAIRLIAQAKQAVAPFGARAGTLHDLADWLRSSAG